MPPAMSTCTVPSAATSATDTAASQTAMPTGIFHKSASKLKHKVSQSTAMSQKSSSGETCLSDSPVKLEGWVRLWENANCISPADLSWMKDDTERGLFTHVQVYKQSTGTLKRRRVMKSDRMWFYPPDPPGYVSGAVPSPNLFFRSRIFVWRPVGIWRYSLKCPRGEECMGRGKDVHLYKSGYDTKVRHICDVSNWYTMLTEVLCCGPCTKAGRKGEGGEVGRWLAWDNAILCQLSEAHQAMTWCGQECRAAFEGPDRG